MVASHLHFSPLTSHRRPRPVFVVVAVFVLGQASRFGLVAAAQEIFDGAEAAGLARREDYEAMLWGCGDYAGQLVFLTSTLSHLPRFKTWQNSRNRRGNRMGHKFRLVSTQVFKTWVVF